MLNYDRGQDWTCQGILLIQFYQQTPYNGPANNKYPSCQHWHNIMTSQPADGQDRAGQGRMEAEKRNQYREGKKYEQQVEQLG